MRGFISENRAAVVYGLIKWLLYLSFSEFGISDFAGYVTLPAWLAVGLACAMVGNLIFCFVLFKSRQSTAKIYWVSQGIFLLCCVMVQIFNIQILPHRELSNGDGLLILGSHIPYFLYNEFLQVVVALAARLLRKNRR